MRLRNIIPARTGNVGHKNGYKAYRDQLASDFNHRCGYCDDRDVPRASSFEIDHFVPQKVDSDRVNDYSNLVYACESCNNAKRAKWPTGDKLRPNDGKVGWLDPCLEEYDNQFERSDDGKIKPITELGQWMHDNLNLWKKQHEILWNCERLEVNINELNALYQQGKLPDEQKNSLIQLYGKYLNLLKSFYRI